jgi:hypothetical protein
MKYIAALFSIYLGCLANGDYLRQNYTTFEPFPGQGGFRFVCTKTTSPDEKDSERERVEWLETYLKDNKLCPNGYSIDERKVVLKDRADVDWYAIYYYGRCR